MGLGFSKTLLVVALGAAAAGAAVFTHVDDGGLAAARRAEASVAVLMTLDELVVASQRVVIGTPTERTSRWEELPSGRRIVTYTKVTVDETLAGGPGAEVVVRTFGGVVDDIGQQVSGEASFTIGERSLMFLADVPDGVDGATVTIVTGMAQGQFPVDESGAEPTLKASRDRGTLVKRRGPSVPAALVLVGQSVATARTKIAESVERMRGEH